METKEFRKSKNMTQEEFANFCGVTSRTIQTWEKENVMPELLKKYIELHENSSCNNNNTNSVNVSSNNGNVSVNTDKFLQLLENSQHQIDVRDTQITQLMGIIEKLSQNK